MSLSHADRILLILMDGGWHSTRAILREVPSIVHSRISDLRKTGLEIEHRTVGVGAAGSEYRLLGPPGSKATETAAVVAAPGDPSSPPLSGDEPWQQPSPGGPGRSESPAALPDTRPLVSSSPLSGDPGARLAARANQGPFSEPSAARQVQPRARSREVILAASPPLRADKGNHADGSLSGATLTEERDACQDATLGVSGDLSSVSGASAQTGREGHGRPSPHCGRETDDPSVSPPVQPPLPGIAA